MEEIDIKVPAIVVRKTDIITLVVDRLNRCWSPKIRMNFITNRGMPFPLSNSTLRSGAVRFLHFFCRTETVPVLEVSRTGPEPVKTDENRFKQVRTGPEINVLKYSLNKNILQMFVKVNCRPLFYVYFKPLTIQIG